MNTRLYDLVNSGRFERSIGTVIVVNAIGLGAQTYTDARWLNALNAICLAVFVGELGLRIAAYGRRFGSNGWNVFDAAVIALSIIPGFGAVAQIARLARVARLIRFLPDAQVLLSGALRSLPALGSLFALTGLLIFLYGMVGVALLGASMPDQFGNLGAATLTLFVMLSLENFPDTLYAGIEVTPWALPFFISYALLAAFVVFNLIIGIVISSLEDARDAKKSSGTGELADEIEALRVALDSLEGAMGAEKREKTSDHS